MIFADNDFFRVFTFESENLSIAGVELILAEGYNLLCCISGLLPVATIEVGTHLDGQCSPFGNAAASGRLIVEQRDGAIDVFVEIVPHLCFRVARHFGGFGILILVFDDGHTAIPEVHVHVGKGTDGQSLTEEVVLHLVVRDFGLVDVVHNVVAGRNLPEVVKAVAGAGGCPEAVAHHLPTFPREVVVGNVGGCVHVEHIGVEIAPALIAGDEELVDLVGILPRGGRRQLVVRHSVKKIGA